MIKYFLSWLRDFLTLSISINLLHYLLRANKYRPNSLTIVKLDAIGDYVLFRNFLKDIRQSEKYRNSKITLVGNPSWAELAIALDSKFIDEFVWIDRTKFQKNIRYLIKKILILSKIAPEIVVHPSYTRDAPSDIATKFVSAKITIGCECEVPNMRASQKKITDKFYSKLIETEPQTKFDFFRNKEVLEKALGITLYTKKPEIDISLIKDTFIPEKKFAVLFPGANHENRRWRTENFAKVADYIINNYGLEIYVCGSKTDSIYFEKIISASMQPHFIKNQTGKSLTLFAKMLSKSEIVVTNDTSCAHISAAVGARTISLLNGRHFGRFSPYPNEFNLAFLTVYPPKIMAMMETDYDKIAKLYKTKTDCNINTITVETVNSFVDKILKNE